MLELWGMWSTPSLPSFSDTLLPRVVAPDRVLSISQKEQTMCANKWLILNLWLLCSNTWNHLTVCKKKSSGSFKNVIYKIYKMCLQIIYLIYMNKEDLALNNLQWLICHKTQPNQIIYIQYICMKRIWHWITYNSWDAIKPNPTKSYIFNIYV